MRQSYRNSPHRVSRACVARGARGVRTLHLDLTDKVRQSRTRVLKWDKLCHDWKFLVEDYFIYLLLLLSLFIHLDKTEYKKSCERWIRLTLGEPVFVFVWFAQCITDWLPYTCIWYLYHHLLPYISYVAMEILREGACASQIRIEYHFLIDSKYVVVQNFNPWYGLVIIRHGICYNVEKPILQDGSRKMVLRPSGKTTLKRN